MCLPDVDECEVESGKSPREKYLSTRYDTKIQVSNEKKYPIEKSEVSYHVVCDYKTCKIDLNATCMSLLEGNGYLLAKSFKLTMQTLTKLGLRSR